MKGYLLGIAAAVSYGMNPLFALPLYADGMDAGSVLFFRYLFGIVIMGVMLLYRQPKEITDEGATRNTQTDTVTGTEANIPANTPANIPANTQTAPNKHIPVWRVFRLNRRFILPVASYGLLMAISSLTLFNSYLYMNAGIASTILFVYPVMVAVLMALFFHERLTLHTVVCMVTALLGILLLYKQKDGATLDLTGTLLALASALTYAIYLVGINRHGLKQIPTLKVTFYVLLSGWVVFLCQALLRNGLTLPHATHGYLWINLLALGLLPTAVSFLCTTAAIQRIGSTPTAILGALEPATAVFFGITVFGERLTLREATGLLLIVLAVTLIVAGGKITQPLIRFRKLFPKGKK